MAAEWCVICGTDRINHRTGQPLAHRGAFCSPCAKWIAVHRKRVRDALRENEQDRAFGNSNQYLQQRWI